MEKSNKEEENKLNAAIVAELKPLKDNWVILSDYSIVMKILKKEAKIDFWSDRFTMRNVNDRNYSQFWSIIDHFRSPSTIKSILLGGSESKINKMSTKKQLLQKFLSLSHKAYFFISIDNFFLKIKEFERIIHCAAHVNFVYFHDWNITDLWDVDELKIDTEYEFKIRIFGIKNNSLTLEDLKKILSGIYNNKSLREGLQTIQIISPFIDTVDAKAILKEFGLGHCCLIA